MKWILILFVSISLAYGRSIWSKPCHRKDPELNKCIVDLIHAAKPNLKPQERFKKMNVKTTMLNYNVDITMKNLLVHGLSQFKIDHFKINFLSNKNKYTGEMKIVHPHVNIKADYRILGTGKQIKDWRTHGSLTGNYKTVTAKYTYEASAVTRDGVEYLTLDSVKIKINLENGRQHLLQHDRNGMGQIIANKLTNNPQDKLEEMFPDINHAVAKSFKEYMNEALSKVPLASILVD